MPSADFQREDLIKAKRDEAAAKEATARADRPDGDRSLLSALGNARVQRLLRSAQLRRQAADGGGGSVDDDVAGAIQAKRGTGQTLDEAARRDLEPALGQDFSDVRVHTDGEADALNRAVKAEAFTTGRDIFFRNGNYDPGSDQGKKLLAHELTHVVQQRSAPAAQELTVSSPQDESELQAGDVADSVNSQGAEAASVGRQEAPEEEEEELQMARIQREAAPEEEEEELQMSSIERAEAPEKQEQPA